MKEYIKLSTEQFRAFVDLLPTLFDLLEQMDTAIADSDADKFNSLLTEPYGFYAQIYERPLIEHLALVVSAIGKQAQVSEMATASDPQQALLDSIRVDLEEEDTPANPAFGETTTLALSYALSRSIKAIAAHGRSLSSLMHEVRETGSQKALFQIIRIDRAAMACPTVMAFVARAQMRNDKAFFKKLANALSGPSEKEWRGLDRLRYALLILRELGLNDLTEKELTELMVDKLGVYTPGSGDARKNLRAHYARSRKIPTI